MNIAEASETRCGWSENPPMSGNWWLTDADNNWIMSSLYLDSDSWNEVPDINQFSCVCLTVDVDKKNRRILKIYNGKGLPVKKCKDDPALLPQKGN
jgi:hypothetical protein